MAYHTESHTMHLNCNQIAFNIISMCNFDYVFFVPISPANWANRILKINGNESSIVLVSELKRFKILPTGVMSKKLNSVYPKWKKEATIKMGISAEREV